MDTKPTNRHLKEDTVEYLLASRYTAWIIVINNTISFEYRGLLTNWCNIAKLFKRVIVFGSCIVFGSWANFAQTLPCYKNVNLRKIDFTVRNSLVHSSILHLKLLSLNQRDLDSKYINCNISYWWKVPQRTFVPTFRE